MCYVTPQMLVDALPIETGDIVLLASDVQRLFWSALKNDKKFDFQQFIDLLKKKVTQEGTLLFPTYNWSFCQGEAFDYYKTRSLTGSLSQIALEREDFVRTKHALYSFAVWGKDTEVLCKMNDKNAFVGDTPFSYFEKNKKAKMLSIDVALTHCFTFVHYVEEANEVSYRYLKSFTGDYIDEKGKISNRVYSMYVRDLNINGNVDFSGLEKILLEKNLMKINFVSDIMIRSLSFMDAYLEIEHDIRANHSANIIHII